jgi:hypothetical protein
MLTGVGPVFGAPIAAREAYLLEGAIPQVRLIFGNGTQATMIAWAKWGGAFQQWETGAPLRWRGRLSLQRCAYTQLTEGGPVEMPPVQTHARFEDGVLTIENPALGLAVAVAGFPPDESWERRADGPLEIEIEGDAGITTLVYAFGPTAAEARDTARRLAHESSRSLRRELDGWRKRLSGLPESPAVRRGLVYGLMLAVPVGVSRCILTDHMLLPLSWNRDAYYVARMLLDRGGPLTDIVRRHLLWMFEVAERADGLWGRCYLANGRIKDRAFQLDQQLFPLLELAEYVLETGDDATWQQHLSTANRVLEALLSRKNPHLWLFPTDETPADDPLAMPYHLSSHILLWRTFQKLADLDDNDAWRSLAEIVRATVLRQFVVTADGGPLYAYAVDGQGHSHLYHDANDLPLALAPAWGFVPAGDPVWRATVAFAFSEKNTGGCYGGRLGSVHTPAPWPLGDVQEMIIARALDDPAREQRALERLESQAQWDGALPEAYHPDSGAVVSRHWFAWPNAALACYRGSG